MRVEALRDAIDSVKPTDEQKEKIKTILDKFRDDMQSKLQELRDLQPQERMQQVRGMFEDLRDKIGSVLNDEQREALNKKIEEMQQRFRNGGGPGGGAGAGGGFLDRLRDGMSKLDLTDDQKQQLQSLREETQKKMQEIRDSAQGDMQKMREKMPEIVQDAMSKMRDILSPEQMQKLRESMMNGAGNNGPGGADRPFRGGMRRPTTAPSAKPKDENNAEKKPEDTKGASAPAGGGGLEVGQEAPNFELKKLDGRSVQLSYFKGKVLVLIFGSYSCPTFRKQAASLDQLAKSHINKADFLIVYTKEAHPKGGHQIERNKQDDVEVEAPADDADRRALAKKAKESLHLTLPIAIDSMDDATGKAYNAIPNGAVVVGKDGQVFAHQKWADPAALAELIDEAAVVHVQ